jgi:hypothetical protein
VSNIVIRVCWLWRGRHLFTHSLTHILTHSHTHSHTHSLTHSLMSLWYFVAQTLVIVYYFVAHSLTHALTLVIVVIYHRLFDFMCSSTELCSTIVTAVFEALNALSGSEKSKAAKQVRSHTALFQSLTHLLAHFIIATRYYCLTCEFITALH